ncbi:MAG: UDP-N-acetylglucosamine diphosphorylase [Parachlamydiaceae bacterium]|nr:UDP-N-acetylglucosamine diphosphorylase [Parachlamydiaceae bacterium]
MELLTSYFFDLTSFPFRDLFDLEVSPWAILPKIEKYLKGLKLGKIEGQISPSAYLVNPELISIGQGSVVEPGAYIQGPCRLGKNCIVRHGAYIRGNFIAGDGCVIGHDTEVKNSIFLSGVHAAHFAYVGDSILGNKVNLGAGTKCANLKLDQSPVVIHYQSQRIPTTLKKLGAILGDGTQIGCNSVTNPGTLMGQEVRCYPCTNIGGFIPSRSIVKPDTKMIVTSYNNS